MSHEHTSATAIGTLTALIEAAPDAPEEESAPITPQAPCYVREAHGWGLKYCEQITLHGEQWLGQFSVASRCVAKGGIIALLGGRGPGKTQMAAEIARGGEWCCDKTEFFRGDGLVTITNKTALYRRAMDIFLDLREAAKNHVKSSEKEVLAKLANVGLLVIDEFQERGESDWENRVMKNLLDKRYSSGRPTIIIANLKRGDMGNALGDSIKDRIRENGTVIEFNWASYRQQP